MMSDISDHITNVNVQRLTQQLDDAEQQGYVDGYADGQDDTNKSRPLRISLIFALGLLIGTLTSFFLFYKG